MNANLIANALNIIIANPNVLGSFPNIPFPTMGGKIWWNTIAKEKGWKVQQNQFTHHVRILDSNDVRRAWGTESAMEELFRKIIKD